jgi:DUF917 family protein
MATIQLDKRKMEAAVLGGAVLGGGGGGWIEDGMQLGRLALEVGHPRLVTIDELDDDATIVTVSLVGAPAAPDKYVKPVHYLRALELLSERMGGKIDGIITNENGASTTVNGWFQSAVTGIPVVDAPCNGRAHPTGSMGSMNLSEQSDYVSVQAAAGGRGRNNVELAVSGALDTVSSMIRTVSISAGGMVAVARNPVKAAYVRQNGAPGAIQQAIQVGEALLAHEGEKAVDAVVALLGGNVIAMGEVTGFHLETTGGFDVGRVIVGACELTFWNEYMTAEINGERLATFPDLIMTFDAESGRPLVSAAVTRGQKVAVIAVPKENLRLGSTMRNKNLIQPIEKIIGKPVLPYVFGNKANEEALRDVAETNADCL